MPPKPAKIDKAKAKHWLNSKWTQPHNCPICGSDKWSIPEELVELRQFYHGSIVMGGGVYPNIVVICTVCGYTFFMNAVIAGLVDSKSEDKEEGE